MYVSWLSIIGFKLTSRKHIDQYGAERDLRAFGSVHTLATLENIENEIRKVDGNKDPLLVTNLQWKYVDHHMFKQTLSHPDLR
jgi:hypothetical protein